MKTIVFLLLFASATQADKNLSVYINDVFNLTNSSERPCVCVKHYQCLNNTIITDGSTIFEKRLGDNPCNDVTLFCCYLPDVVQTRLQLKETCGLRNVEGVNSRISGDNNNNAQFGEFPWMVAVLYYKNNLLLYKCGGALIHKSVVLTAAHCVIDSQKKFAIRAGEWNAQNNDEILDHVDRNVQSTSIHPEYYSGGLHNDIALLFLESPITFANHINVVCLPPPDMTFDNSECIATGWGKNSVHGAFQNILKKVKLTVDNRNTCQDSLQKTRLGKKFKLNKSFICATGDFGEDTCTGDDGSPLVCPVAGKTNTYVQAGIVSWGISCGENLPSMYVNVPLFRGWIDEQLTKKGYNI